MDLSVQTVAPAHTREAYGIFAFSNPTQQHNQQSGSCLIDMITLAETASI